MAKVLTDQTNYTNIANAIRSKNGKTDKYTPAQMPDAIKAITTGSTGIDESVLAGLIDGSLTTLRVPDTVTSIRNQAFAGMSGLTLNINAAYNGISGKPWGATTPTINWLRATKAKVTITQSEHQTITVTTDDGVAHTESFEYYINGTFTVKVIGDSGYMGGTPSATSGTISGAVTITATAATVLKLQTQPWTVNKNNANADNTFAIKIDDGTIYPLHPAESDGEKGLLHIDSGAFAVITSFSPEISAEDFDLTQKTPLYNFMSSHSAKISLKDTPTTTSLVPFDEAMSGLNIGIYMFEGTVPKTILDALNNSEDIIIDFVNPSGGGGSDVTNMKTYEMKVMDMGGMKGGELVDETPNTDIGIALTRFSWDDDNLLINIENKSLPQGSTVTITIKLFGEVLVFSTKMPPVSKESSSDISFKEISGDLPAKLKAFDGGDAVPLQVGVKS